jgi:hypothetical protein
LWINYSNNKGQILDIEIPFIKIIKLLHEAGEIVDYDKDDLQMIILPDSNHINTVLYITLKSNRILINTTKFWNSYRYKERSIYMYLETLK